MTVRPNGAALARTAQILVIALGMSALGMAPPEGIGESHGNETAWGEQMPSAVPTSTPEHAVSPTVWCLPPQPASDLSPEFAPAIGSGPMFAVAGDRGRIGSALDDRGDWLPVKVLWVADAAYRGTGVIRGVALDGGPSGALSRSPGRADSVELVIDWSGVMVSPRSGWKEVPSAWTVPRPGCFGWVVGTPEGEQTIWYEVVAPEVLGLPGTSQSSPPT